MLLCQYEVQVSHCRIAVQQSALLAAISDPCPHSWQCTLAFIYIHMYIMYQNIYSYTSRYFPKHIFIIYCAAKCPVGRPLLPPLTLVVGKSFGLETWLGNVISFSFGLLILKITISKFKCIFFLFTVSLYWLYHRSSSVTNNLKIPVHYINSHLMIFFIYLVSQSY